MNQVNARHEIIREWRSLPKEQRQTDEQAAGFAMQIKDKYKFSSDTADPYQTVKGWLLSYLSSTRGLERTAEGGREMSGNVKSTDRVGGRVSSSSLVGVLGRGRYVSSWHICDMPTASS